MAPTMAHTIQHCPLLFPVDVNHVFLAPLQVACRARPLSVIFCPEGSWISNFRDSARVGDTVNGAERCLAFYLQHVISFCFTEPRFI